MDIITRIKNRIAGRAKQEERFNGKEQFDYRTVFRFDAWKLFKGHSGNITVTNRMLCFDTSIFSYRCHQWISNTGDQSLHINHRLFFPPTKWLSSRLDSFEANLTKYKLYHGHPKFVCEFEDYTFCLEYHSHITLFEKYPSFKSLNNHAQMISVRNKLNKRGRRLLNVIKNMSDEEFFTQVLAYNPDIKPDSTGYVGIIEYKLPSDLLG